MTTDTSLADLIRAAVEPDASPASLDALRARRDEIEPLLARDVTECLPWLAADDPELVVAALRLVHAAFPETTQKPVSDERLAWIRAKEDDHRRIGRCYATVLLPALDGLPTLAQALEGTTRQGREVVDALLRDVSVVAGGSEAAALTPHGVTPVTVAEASSVLGHLAEMALDDAPGVDHVLMGAHAESLHGASVSLADARQGVEGSVDLPTDVSAHLTDWVLLAATRVPLLVASFRATSTATGLRLDPTDEPMTWDGRNA